MIQYKPLNLFKSYKFICNTLKFFPLNVKKILILVLKYVEFAVFFCKTFLLVIKLFLYGINTHIKHAQ